MKKLFTIFFSLLCTVHVVMAGNAHVYVYSSPTAGGYVDVQNSNTAPGSYSYTDDHDSQSGLGANRTFYLFYEAKPGYKFQNWYKTTAANYNSKATLTNTGDLKAQGQSVTQNAPVIGNGNSYYAGIFAPISYSIVFHGNGNTDGSMSDLAMKYDAAKNLTSNGFVRSFTISINANEGVCEETEMIAAYTMSGWATAENGEVVYADGERVNNLTQKDGHTIDLYAVWTGGSIVLPEVTKEGELFNGWYNGDVWVGNAGDSYLVTEDTELTAHWAEHLTPMFTLSSETIELEQAAVLSLTNVSEPTVEFAPSGIVSYDPATGAITGLAVGEVTITIDQAETNIIAAKHEELHLSVTKKTPSLKVLLNGKEDSEVEIIQGGTATIDLEYISDAVAVNVEPLEGIGIITYSENVLTSTGAMGTTRFRATLPETDVYQSVSVEWTATVVKNPIHLPLTMSSTIWSNSQMKVDSRGNNSWNNDKGISLGDANGDGFNWDDRYIILHFEGVPDKLTFQIATDVIGIGQTLGGATNVEWYVQESATINMSNEKIWTETRAANSYSDTYSVELQPTTRYVKLCYSGNFSGVFHNVEISEKKYVQDPEPASVDFGKAVIYTGEVSSTVNVNWCNIAPMTVTSSNPRFTVTPATFGSYDQMGSQEITISYTHTDEEGENEGDITISNGDDTYTKIVHVHALTTKHEQVISWNEELANTGFAMNVGERYPDENVLYVATVPSGKKVILSSADSTIIEVVDDTMLVAKAVGEVEITAYQAGDDQYAEVVDKKLFIVSELFKQSITWEQNLFGVLTTDDSIVLNASATSGMPIVYTSGDENVVRIAGDTMIVVGEGETYITALQAGGEDENEVEWLPISLNNYVVVRNPASKCKEMALSVASLTLSNSGSLTKEYELAGTPTNLTFTAKHGQKSNGAWGQAPTYAALLVDQYTKIDGVWGWQNIYNKVVGTGDTGSGILELDEEAKKVRFRTSETGTDHTITDIRVARKEYMRSSVEFIDEEAESKALWQKTITIAHSNIDLMTVTSQNGLVTLSTALLGAGCGDFGEDEFVVSFTPMMRDTIYEDTIIITDGKADPKTITIPLKLSSVGFNQVITGFELPSSCNALDKIEIPASSASSGLEVVYLSSDSTIAYVANDSLVILSAGTVDIIAYQAGDNQYREVSLAKTIEIIPAAVVIAANPEASEIRVGETLAQSELQGGEASVDGQFAWENPEIMPEVGAHAYNVLFTPANPLYEQKIVPVELSVLKEETLELAYPIAFCEGDSAEYRGKWYYEAAVDSVWAAGVTRDTVYVVTVTVNPNYTIVLSEDTLHLGDTLFIGEGEWYRVFEDDIVLVEDSAIVLIEEGLIELRSFHTVEATGCDSTVIRRIVVTQESTDPDPSVVPTGLDELEAKEQAVKFLRDGVIYIRRGEKEYTPAGLRVR